MAYCTVAELQALIDAPSMSAAKQNLVTNLIIPAAEENINTTCNRPDGFEALAVATARTYAGLGLVYQYIDECVEVTAVGVKESVTDSSYTAWAAGDYIPCSGDPENPNFNRLPYSMLIVDPTGDQAIFTSGKYSNLPGFQPDIDYGKARRGVPTVQVTAKWGYSVAVPSQISTACLMQVARWFKRLEGAMGDSLASGELGTIMYRQSLDPDIRRILIDGRFVRPPVG